MKRNNVFAYAMCAVFAALTGVLSQVLVPLPFTPVPINLALLAVFICGGALGAKRGAISMVVYILLGAVGAPMFAGLQGGIGHIAGPTGGYIIGYLPAAAIMGWMMNRMHERLSGGVANADARPADGNAQGGRFAPVSRTLLAIAAGIPAIAACYALGTAWFMFVTGRGLAESLLMCVVPFIAGDVLKVVAAAFVCEALRRPVRAIMGAMGARA